jgi:MoaD family protein
MVKILYFAEFKLITKKEEETIQLRKERSVKELVNRLIEKYPKMEKLLVTDHGKSLKNTISLSVNHSVVKRDNLMSKKLKENDIIAFLLPVSGG